MAPTWVSGGQLRLAKSAASQLGVACGSPITPGRHFDDDVARVLAVAGRRRDVLRVAVADPEQRFEVGVAAGLRGRGSDFEPVDRRRRPLPRAPARAKRAAAATTVAISIAKFRRRPIPRLDRCGCGEAGHHSPPPWRRCLACRPLWWRLCFRLCLLVTSSSCALARVGAFPRSPRSASLATPGLAGRGVSGPVALVGGFAGRQRRDEREAAVGAGVVEGEERAVFVLRNQHVAGREVDVDAVGADPGEPGRRRRGVCAAVAAFARLRWCRSRW